MKCLWWIVCCVSLVQSVPAQLADRNAYLREFEKRSARVVSVYDTSQAAGYYQIAVRYALKRNIAQADSMFVALLREPRGDMFWMIPVIGAYLHGKDRMSPLTKASVRSAWKTYAPYRGDTENHWCMYYSALFLAAEQWPGLPGSEWYNGKSSEENRQEAKEYLIIDIEGVMILNSIRCIQLILINFKISIILA